MESRAGVVSTHSPEAFLNPVARNLLLPVPGMDLFVTIKYLDASIDKEVRFIAGQFLAGDNSSVKLAFAAIGFRGPKVGAGRRGVVGMNVILVIHLRAGGPTVTVIDLGPRIRLEKK